MLIFQGVWAHVCTLFVGMSRTPHGPLRSLMLLFSHALELSLGGRSVGVGEISEKNPGCLGYMSGMKILLQLYGDYNKPL